MDESQRVNGDDFSLRDTILTVQGYALEVLRLWYIPVFFGLVVAGYKLYQYIKYTPVYPATITFSVDEDEGGGSTGLSSMLGQIGLGGVRPARYNLDKILELSKSRRVVQQTLFTKVTIDGKEDFLANHLLRIYKLDERKGEDGKMMAPFYFTKDSVAAFNRDENAVLLQLHNFIIGPPSKPKDALVVPDYNEDTNIMSLSAATKDEALSIELARRSFEALSNYYVTKAIEKQVKTYKIVSAKRDSVLAVLKSVEYQLANFKDTHRSLLMRTDQVTELRLQRELTALSAMYAEVLKNTEVADFSLRNKTPFIQVIDIPIQPIAPSQLSLIRQLLKGLILGGLVGVALVLGRKIYLGIMNRNEPVRSY